MVKFPEFANLSEEVEKKIISVECYKAFRGTMLVTPGNPNFKPYELYGDWLFKPDVECWYCKGCSFPRKVCRVVSVD